MAASEFVNTPLLQVL